MSHHISDPLRCAFTDTNPAQQLLFKTLFILPFISPVYLRCPSLWLLVNTIFSHRKKWMFANSCLCGSELSQRQSMQKLWLEFKGITCRVTFLAKCLSLVFYEALSTWTLYGKLARPHSFTVGIWNATTAWISPRAYRGCCWSFRYRHCSWEQHERPARSHYRRRAPCHRRCAFLPLWLIRQSAAVAVISCWILSPCRAQTRIPQHRFKAQLTCGSSSHHRWTEGPHGKSKSTSVSGSEAMTTDTHCWNVSVPACECGGIKWRKPAVRDLQQVNHSETEWRRKTHFALKNKSTQMFLAPHKGIK